MQFKAGDIVTHFGRVVEQKDDGTVVVKSLDGLLQDGMISIHSKHLNIVDRPFGVGSPVAYRGRSFVVIKNLEDRGLLFIQEEDAEPDDAASYLTVRAQDVIKLPEDEQVVLSRADRRVFLARSIPEPVALEFAEERATIIDAREPADAAEDAVIEADPPVQEVVAQETEILAPADPEPIHEISTEEIVEEPAAPAATDERDAAPVHDQTEAVTVAEEAEEPATGEALSLRERINQAQIEGDKAPTYNPSGFLSRYSDRFR